MTVAVKICGLSTPETIDAAVAAGADMVGFMFYPASPRNVSAEQFQSLCRRVPPGIQRVGIFVDATDDTIAAVLKLAPLDILQFHGKETPERIGDAKIVHRRPVMKAISIAGREDVLRARRYVGIADWLLFDAKPPKPAPGVLPGGNGLAFDWSLLAGAAWGQPWMLSGGLDAGNVAQAIGITGAPAVDVSSGVESRPGVKDIAKIGAFIRAAKGAARDTAPAP